MTKLALIRHGHTHWNRLGQIQGRTDIPLDDAARAELSEYHLPEPWDEADLVSSPLQRAVETAQIISRGQAPARVPELIEMDWGDWEGRRGVDLKAETSSGFRDIEYWGWDYRPPRGESPGQVWARLAPWVAGLTTDTLAVCHIGVMRMILAKATAWDFTGPPPFRIKRNRLYVLELDCGLRLADPEPVRLIRQS